MKNILLKTLAASLPRLFASDAAALAAATGNLSNGIWLLLAGAFFVTSIVGVVTGSNSLITVPLMLQVGIAPQVAIATNMFGLTFMAAGGALPFVGKNVFPREHLVRLIALTLVGSVIGAFLTVLLPPQSLPVIISVAMIAVAIFSMWQSGEKKSPSLPNEKRAAELNVADALNPEDADAAHTAIVGANEKRRNASAAIKPSASPTAARIWLAYILTFALGIYGGFYSGGYVTMLTVVFVALLNMSYLEAVATTKLVNVFSSAMASAIFMWRGLVDYRLGIMLGAVMFVGAFVGARVALKLNAVWLKRIFLLTVILLAAKILLYDVVWRRVFGY